MLNIPTEPIGSIPRPPELLNAIMPFCDDTTTSRETAFAKIRARVLGTALASDRLQGN